MSENDKRKAIRYDCSDIYESNINHHGFSRVPSDSQMAASYTEIAFQSQSPTKHDGEEVDNLYCNDKNVKREGDKEDYNKDQDFRNADDNAPKRPVSLLCDKAFPCDLEGTVHREGEMMHFFTENLEYKIKLSSPITKRDINQPSVSSKNGTNSTSAGLLPRHFLQPQLAQIDSNVLSDIEIDAQYLAASVDNLTENLYNLLHSVSSITADNVEIHKNSVNKLTDNMDANIKCMYTIMAKTEEISKSMKPTEQLALRIREIKRLVDMLENNL